MTETRKTRHHRYVVIALVLMFLTGAVNLLDGALGIRGGGVPPLENGGRLGFGTLMLGLAFLAGRRRSAGAIAVAAALILGQGIIDLFAVPARGEAYTAFALRLCLVAALTRGYLALNAAAPAPED